MAVETLAAVALAGNILQFVQVGLQLVSIAGSLKRSHDGQFKDHSDIQKVIQDLDTRLAQIESSDDASDETLKALSKRSRELGSDLRDALVKIKKRGGDSLFSSYRQALSIVWNKKSVEAAESGLIRLRDEVDFHLQTKIKQDTSTLLQQLSVATQAFQSLKESAQLTKDIALKTRDNQIADSRNLSIEVRELRTLHARLLDVISEVNMSNQGASGMPRPPKARDFLESLKFRRMDERQEQIPSAYAQTYEWLLSDGVTHPDSNFEQDYLSKRHQLREQVMSVFDQLGIDARTCATFSLSDVDICPIQTLHEWLRSGEGVFWIQGKPGCGKSTFMKAVLQKPAMTQTRDRLLEEWAQGLHLVKTVFFFFRPGDSLQKSHCGILRSLVYQILDQDKDMIGQIFSAKEQIMAVKRSLGASDADESIWSVHELQTALRKWRRTCTSKLYLHVDGIDEVDAPSKDVVEILEDIAALGNVKILAAGRRTPEFTAAFGQPQRNFALHEATDLDILQYVVGRLNSSDLVNALDDPAVQFLAIAEEIVGAARGVFQWVKIVVDSIFQGSLFHEGFQCLYERLKRYPSDLDELYLFILKFNLKEEYLPDAAFWLLTMASVRKLHLGPSSKRNMSRGTLFGSKRIFGQDMKSVSHITAATILLANQFDSRSMSAFWATIWQAQSEQVESSKGKIKKARKMAEMRLRERIAVQCPHFIEFGSPSAGYPLEYAHRTVLDFFCQEKPSRYLEGALTDGKSPFLSLLATQLSKSTSHSKPIDYIGLNDESTSFPALQVAECLVQADYDLAEQFLRSLRPFFTMLDGNGNRSAILPYPTLHGWRWGSSYADVLNSLFEHERPLIHYLSMHGLPLDLIVSRARQLDLSYSERELLLFEHCWDYDDRTSCLLEPMDKKLFSVSAQHLLPESFPPGVSKSLSLSLLMPWLRLACENFEVARPGLLAQEITDDLNSWLTQAHSESKLLGTLHFLCLPMIRNQGSEFFDAVLGRIAGTCKTSLMSLREKQPTIQASLRILDAEDNSEEERPPERRKFYWDEGMALRLKWLKVFEQFIQAYHHRSLPETERYLFHLRNPGKVAFNLEIFLRECGRSVQLVDDDILDLSIEKGPHALLSLNALAKSKLISMCSEGHG